MILLPRFGGSGLRGMVVGDTVLSGRRYGRAVRIEMGGRSIRMLVETPGVPDRPPIDDGGATLWATGGWIGRERRISGAGLAGPDGLVTFMRDLQRTEQVAGAPVAT